MEWRVNAMLSCRKIAGIFICGMFRRRRPYWMLSFFSQKIHNLLSHNAQKTEPHTHTHTMGSVCLWVHYNILRVGFACAILCCVSFIFCTFFFVALQHYNPLTTVRHIYKHTIYVIYAGVSNQACFESTHINLMITNYVVACTMVHKQNNVQYIRTGANIRF